MLRYLGPGLCGLPQLQGGVGGLQSIQKADVCRSLTARATSQGIRLDHLEVNAIESDEIRRYLERSMKHKWISHSTAKPTVIHVDNALFRGGKQHKRASTELAGDATAKTLSINSPRRVQTITTKHANFKGKRPARKHRLGEKR